MTLCNVHKTLGYMLKCKEKHAEDSEIITKWYKPIKTIVKMFF